MKQSQAAKSKRINKKKRHEEQLKSAKRKGRVVRRQTSAHRKEMLSKRDAARYAEQLRVAHMLTAAREQRRADVPLNLTMTAGPLEIMKALIDFIARPDWFRGVHR